MSSNPANLIFRFFLETAGLVALGVWGWSLGSGVFRYILAVVAPLAAAFAWGSLRVPGDATQRGEAVLVPIPGLLRLALEAAFFGFAIWGLAESGNVILAWIFAILVGLHYALSVDRIVWLVRRGAPRKHIQRPKQH